MLTSLSRSLRRIFDAAFAKAGPAAAAWADESVERPMGWQPPARPALRLVSARNDSVKDRDTAVAVGAPEPRPAAGASAFVAGAGARIYSLEVFRRERAGRPGPRTPARPRVA
jgi:hypothetical protein